MEYLGITTQFEKEFKIYLLSVFLCEKKFKKISFKRSLVLIYMFYIRLAHYIIYLKKNSIVILYIYFILVIIIK